MVQEWHCRQQSGYKGNIWSYINVHWYLNHKQELFCVTSLRRWIIQPEATVAVPLTIRKVMHKREFIDWSLMCWNIWKQKMTFSKTGSVHVVKVGHSITFVGKTAQCFSATGNAVKEKSGEFEFYNVFTGTWFSKNTWKFCLHIPFRQQGVNALYWRELFMPWQRWRCNVLVAIKHDLQYLIYSKLSALISGYFIVIFMHKSVTESLVDVLSKA